MLVAGLTNLGGIFLLGVVGFSLGEMLTGPKKNEYLGLIAPPGKKGLYLGYVNIPVGIGGLVGSKLQGFVYGNWGEKAVLAQKYLATEAGYAAADAGIQALGGYGYMQEYEVERFYRDAKITEIYEGTKEIQKNTIASAVIGKLK